MEMARLKLDPTVPLAVQQWQGLIAVNYAAREFGISRHESPREGNVTTACTVTGAATDTSTDMQQKSNVRI